jgi:hypothetical protein
MTDQARKRWNEQYQLKLDLGEGANCHEAYEEYLNYYRLEDNPERWALFCAAFKRFEEVTAMVEKSGATVQ